MEQEILDQNHLAGQGGQLADNEGGIVVQQPGPVGAINEGVNVAPLILAPAVGDQDDNAPAIDNINAQPPADNNNAQPPADNINMPPANNAPGPNHIPPNFNAAAHQVNDHAPAPPIANAEEIQRLMGQVQLMMLNNQRPHRSITFDTSIDKFYGRREDFGRYNHRVRAVWRGAAYDRDEQLASILDSVDKGVRLEINCMPAETRADPELLLVELGRRYGDNRSPSDLTRALLQLQQRPGETARSYSQQLKHVHDLLVARQRAVNIAPCLSLIMMEVLKMMKRICYL